ncbi:MAG TPA: hypothetical protein VIY68_12555 [Steroidobacteraceae bacterium]
MKSALIRNTGVLLTAVSLAWAGAGVSAFAADTQKLSQPPGFSTSLKGAAHDFDYLVGAWTTQQKRLEAVAVGSSEWVDAPANRHCAVPFMGGRTIVEQSQFPNKGPAGLFIYTFSPIKQQWSIRWVNGKTGELEPPYVGGFQGTRGEFYGDDDYDGRPIKVRIIWTNPDPDHARWEQSFSFDERTWEVNWISDFTRGDPAVLCPKA